MNKSINVFIVVVVFIGFLIGSGAFYTVDETQYAVVTQFGKLIGQAKTKAGLYFKLPFVQTVNYFEKRILEWDGDANEIQTLGKRYIWIDTTARWRISDPLKFMQRVRTEASAQARLDDIIDGATRDVIANNAQVEALRNSNRLYEKLKKGEIDDVDFQSTSSEIEKIKYGREILSRRILKQSKPLISDLGVELVDVRIKRVNYIQQVREDVYDRMISEREAAAEKYRSEGKGKKAEIEGQREKELKLIQSEAYRTAQEIRGRADAEAIKIYANAYNRDPEFYAFIKTLDSYGRTINKDTTLILSTDNDFYSLLSGSDAVNSSSSH